MNSDVEASVAASEGRTLQEKQSLLARAAARVGEFARDHTPRKITAGIAAATLLVGGAVGTSNHSTEKAEAASRHEKPYTPKKIGILITSTGTYWGPSSIRPKSAIMTPTKRIVRGPCNPKNEYNPTIKYQKTVITPAIKKDYAVLCNGTKKTDDKTGSPEDLLAGQLNRLGDRVARTAGVTEEMHGDATKIRSNNRVAVLRFERPEAGEPTVAGPVKTITFKNRGKPKVVKYPKAQ